MSTFRPLGVYLSIDPEPEPERRFGSLYLPQDPNWLPDRGTVTAVGRGQMHSTAVLEPHDVEPGDFVLYPPMVSDRKGEGYDTDTENKPVEKPIIVLHGSRSFGVLKPMCAECPHIGVIWRADAHNFRPLYDRLIVRVIELPESARSSIVIPESAKDKPLTGEVLAVGSGKPLKDGSGRLTLDVMVGDIVLFGKWAGDTVRIAERSYLILREDEVLATLDVEPSVDRAPTFICGRNCATKDYYG